MLYLWRGRAYLARVPSGRGQWRGCARACSCCCYCGAYDCGRIDAKRRRLYVWTRITAFTRHLAYIKLYHHNRFPALKLLRYRVELQKLFHDSNADTLYFNNLSPFLFRRRLGEADIPSCRLAWIDWSRLGSCGGGTGSGLGEEEWSAFVRSWSWQLCRKYEVSSPHHASFCICLGVQRACRVVYLPDATSYLKVGMNNLIMT